MKSYLLSITFSVKSVLTFNSTIIAKIIYTIDNIHLEISDLWTQIS